MLGLAAAALALVCLGCSGGTDKDKAAGKGKTANHGHEHHGPGTVEAGKYHANLEAHLEESELDIAFETHDHKPAPQALAGFAAQVKLDAGEFKEVKFEPAPKDGRKGDPEGKCSRFHGKVDGLAKAKKVTVAAKVPLDGKDETLEWRDVDPAKLKHEH
jgi:hypothetical protein